MDSNLSSEGVSAPAGVTEGQDQEMNPAENGSGTQPSTDGGEPPAQAQGAGYKLADGDILIHTNAQV